MLLWGHGVRNRPACAGDLLAIYNGLIMIGACFLAQALIGLLDMD
jgi:hypothetical protein